MKPADFIATHPVFRFDEFVAATSGDEKSPHTHHASLKQHVAGGNLVRVRRGLYASVPRGADASTMDVDPYLVTSKMTDDAVIAYHAALQFHGKAYSIWRRYHFLTRSKLALHTFRGMEFQPVQVPMAQRAADDFGGGIVSLRHAGGTVRVTSLERTLADVLDSPSMAGGWEETLRSLDMVEFFDLDAVIEYAMKLDSDLAIARIGFYLEQRREQLMVEDRHLTVLRARAPKQARYLDSSREPGKLVAGWNLVVTDRVRERGWEEYN